jgi:hypothetical protein
MQAVARWLVEQVPQLKEMKVHFVHHAMKKFKQLCVDHNQLYDERDRWRQTDMSTYGHLLQDVKYSVHHSKILVLFSKTCVRVCVTSANFCPADFHGKTNAVWFQDFPLKDDDIDVLADIDDDIETPVAAVSSPFEDDLVDYFGRYSFLRFLPNPQKPSLIAALRRYDYSGAAATLVPSCPGIAQGDRTHQASNKTTFQYAGEGGVLQGFTHPVCDRDKYGHMKVRRILAATRMRSMRPSLRSSRRLAVLVQVAERVQRVVAGGYLPNW